MVVEWSFFFEYIAPKYGSDFNYPVGNIRDVPCNVIGGVHWNYGFGAPRNRRTTENEFARTRERR